MTSLPNVKKPCAQCPFRKDTLKGWLGAGHMLINGDKNDFVRLAGRLNIELDLSGKELVFDTQKECIEHHEI